MVDQSNPPTRVPANSRLPSTIPPSGAASSSTSHYGMKDVNLVAASPKPTQQRPIQSRQEALHRPIATAAPDRGNKIAVLLKSSPVPQKGLTTTNQRTLDDLWELTKRVKKNIGLTITPPRPLSASARSVPDSLPSKAPTDLQSRVQTTAPAISSIVPTKAPVKPVANITKQDTNGRKRGRPKGSKQSTPYSSTGDDSQPPWKKKTPRSTREARIRAPPLDFRRRPGRPPRQRSPGPHEIYSRTNWQFLPYLCEWHGCKSELHNLETLRRHIHIVHGRCRTLTCQWGACGVEHVFENVHQWQAHLDEAHLIPFLWHLGDGPRNSSGTRPTMQSSAKVDEVPDFLLSADGQQVTPSIKDQELEDFATWRDNRRKLKKLLIRRDMNLADESTDSSQEGE